MQNNGQSEHAAGDFDNASVGSGNSNLSTGALQVGSNKYSKIELVNFTLDETVLYLCACACFQNIREQMAASLERMRELEEQVKAIPMLQVNTAAYNFTSPLCCVSPVHHVPNEESKQ